MVGNGISEPSTVSLKIGCRTLHEQLATLTACDCGSKFLLSLRVVKRKLQEFLGRKKKPPQDMENVYMICICKYVFIYICTHYTRIYFCYDDKVFLLKTTYTICQFRWTTLIQNLGEKGQNLLLSTPGRRFPCFFLQGCLTVLPRKLDPNSSNDLIKTTASEGKIRLKLRPIAIGRFLVTKNSVLAFETAHQLRPTSLKHHNTHENCSPPKDFRRPCWDKDLG